MRKRLGCLGYFLVFSIWLMLMLIPFATFKLARDKQFDVGNTRIFLVTETDAAGVGFQSTRDVNDGRSCQQTTIRFLLWEGEASTTKSCYCEDGIERIPDGGSCISP